MLFTHNQGDKLNSFLVAYDIFDAKRLRKVRNTVYSFALSGQKSALEVPLSKALMTSLVKELKVHAKEADMINIIQIVGEPILLGKGLYESHANKMVIIL